MGSLLAKPVVVGAVVGVRFIVSKLEDTRMRAYDNNERSVTEALNLYVTESSLDENDKIQCRNDIISCYKENCLEFGVYFSIKAALDGIIIVSLPHLLVKGLTKLFHIIWKLGHYIFTKLKAGFESIKNIIKYIKMKLHASANEISTALAAMGTGGGAHFNLGHQLGNAFKNFGPPTIVASKVDGVRYLIQTFKSFIKAMINICYNYIKKECIKYYLYIAALFEKLHECFE
mmetsp:Transcript_41038/g.50528  ORF Transcript_41038/g.50528 Transcript_41038/m.50528 type:complete len:231 (+) Transcript_41038:995-1687(+)